MSNQLLVDFLNSPNAGLYFPVVFIHLALFVALAPIMLSSMQTESPDYHQHVDISDYRSLPTDDDMNKKTINGTLVSD